MPVAKQPKTPKVEAPFIERAMIVITFKGNPNQLGIPFDKLKDAIKQFETMHEKNADEMFVTGPISTACIRMSEVACVVLVDTLAARRLRGEQV
jgi:hypothetical protein